jgi:poly(3-hydroxybutyrate) depolymerase
MVPMRTRRRRFLLLVTAVLAAGALVSIVCAATADRPVFASSVAGELRTATATGRRGAYFLPPGHGSQALPLLVFLHGTGGRGADVIGRVRPLAEREKFIAVAPESASVAGVWLVRPDSGKATEDHRHVVDCVQEVVAFRDVRVDPTRVLIAGFSAGGGAAAHIASHEDVFTAFAILHGHAALDALGPRRVRGWLSTGDQDRTRPVASIRDLADELKGRRGFPDVDVRVFRAGHALGPDELDALVAWWLRR